jgi:hypothetical protein
VGTKTDPTRALASVVLGFSLLSLYLVFLGAFIPEFLLSTLSTVELAVLYTMILRVLALTFVPKLKQTSSALKIVILSFEAFIVLIFIIAYFATADASYGSAISSLLTSWIGSTVIIVTPYAVYMLMLTVYKGGSLFSVLTTTTEEYAVVLVLASIASVGKLPPGVQGLGTLVLNSLVNASGINVLGYQRTLTASVLGIMIFSALVVYVVFYQNSSSLYSRRYNSALLLSALGIFVSLIWIAIAASLGGSIIFVISVPAVILSTAMMVVARGSE